MRQHEIAAMRVDDGEPLYAGMREARADVRDDGRKRACRQPDRAGEAGMFLRAGDGQDGQQQPADFLRQPGRERARDQAVGRERQVAPMLLERAHRQHGERRPADIGGGAS